jgi:large subunit ribosomal protein L1
LYTAAEAVEIVKKSIYTKFDPTIEIAINTFANPKYNDQMIRSTTILPH